MKILTNKKYNLMMNQIYDLNELIQLKNQYISNLKEISHYHNLFLTKSLRILRFQTEILLNLKKQYGIEPIDLTGLE